MNFLISLTVLLISGNLWADDVLPDCKGKANTWTTCSLEYTDGSQRGIYVGEWRDGKRHGQGTHTYASGEKYSGAWIKNKKHGQGTLTYSDGSKYVSIWKNDKDTSKNSKWIDISDKDLPICNGDYKTWTACSYSYSKGVIYIGQWKDGYMHGQGTLTYKDGTKYVGEWKDGKRHGQGKINWKINLKYPDGSGYIREQYSGAWRNDQRNGPGNFFGYKSRYYGMWKNNMKHGQGFYAYPDQSTYDGEWRNDKKHGVGIYTYEDKSRYVGQWSEDKRSGPGSLIYPNGSKYVGQWKDNDKYQGKLFPACIGNRNEWSNCSFLKDGDSYAGEWKDGYKHGQGTLTYRDGENYYGKWKKGKKSGQGIYTLANGSKSKGTWQNDLKHGIFSITNNELTSNTIIFFRNIDHGTSNNPVLKFNKLCKSEFDDEIRRIKYAYNISSESLDPNLALNILKDISENLSQGVNIEISNAEYNYKNCII